MTMNPFADPFAPGPGASLGDIFARSMAPPEHLLGTRGGYFNVNLLRMTETFGIPQDYVARALHSRAASDGVKFSLKKKPTKP